MSTQFGDKYRKWAMITNATCASSISPATRWKWIGLEMSIWDSVTGESVPAYLFIAVLPCSGYAYAEACSDMKLENWLMCHVHAYAYFGGVTRLLIPDNLKTGLRRTPDTWFRTALSGTGWYYDTAVVPALWSIPVISLMRKGLFVWLLPDSCRSENERFFLRQAQKLYGKTGRWRSFQPQPAAIILFIWKKSWNS